MTQIESAKKGIITDQMKRVAANESIEEEKLKQFKKPQKLFKNFISQS